MKRPYSKSCSIALKAALYAHSYYDTIIQAHIFSQIHCSYSKKV